MTDLIERVTKGLRCVVGTWVESPYVAWHDLGQLPGGMAFNESDAGYDPDIESYYVFSSQFGLVNGHSQAQVWVYRAQTVEALVEAEPYVVRSEDGPYRIHYPSALLLNGVWHLWATPELGVPTVHLTTAAPLTEESLWEVTNANAFGWGKDGQNLITDAAVRVSLYHDAVYAVGFTTLGHPPLVMLRASDPSQLENWENLGDIFDGSAPSWANVARPDPNLAVYPDGRAWVFFTGRCSADGVMRPGVVEVDLHTGKAISEAVVLNEYGADGAAGAALSDLVYLASVGGCERGRVLAFGNVSEGQLRWACVDLPGDEE